MQGIIALIVYALLMVGATKAFTKEKTEARASM